MCLKVGDVALWNCRRILCGARIGHFPSWQDCKLSTRINNQKIVDEFIKDFYIITLKFDKFAPFCDEGSCLAFYEKFL